MWECVTQNVCGRVGKIPIADTSKSSGTSKECRVLKGRNSCCKDYPFRAFRIANQQFEQDPSSNNIKILTKPSAEDGCIDGDR